jgi:hypothetical protein
LQVTSSPSTVAFNSPGAGWAYDSIEGARLGRLSTGDYVLHVLGRTGEPLRETPVTLTMAHAWILYVMLGAGFDLVWHGLASIWLAVDWVDLACLLSKRC